MISLRLKHYFCQSLQLHPYLLANLKRRGLFPLKDFQVQSLSHVQNNFNFFLNSCTGSGKTLAYLVPMINGILYRQDEKSEKYPQGGVILTLNKELVAQIHRQIQLLDIDNKLRVARTGASNLRNTTEGPKSDLNDKIGSFVQWNQIDILISTPQALINQLTIYKAQRKNYIDPEFVAIDEADLVIEIDKNVRGNTDKVIQFIRSHSSKTSSIKYMLTASSFPNKYRGADAKPKLQENFRTLKFIEGENKHKLPEKLELFFIQIASADNEANIEQEKMSYLKRILTDRKRQRIIIFCKEKASIKAIGRFIREEMQDKCEQFYAQLRSEERALALSNFEKAGCNILVSSELGSRGLDFSLPIDCIIEFNMAQNITHFINRAGRTARNGLHGEVITFVEKKNLQFFTHLRTLKEQGSEFDELFSRKRSYSKLYKDPKGNLISDI